MGSLKEITFALPLATPASADESRLSPLALTLVMLAFGTLSLQGVYHHEIWLDEAHHWLLARDSDSFSNLVYHARYDGHPLLWNLILFALTRFTYDPFWMQV